ncbi:structural maintenance of chromosomes protein 6B-like isoform X4 [Panicum virgatum]|uniref:structural maintenance of chromosomes protein 6B-like isoform X4 n=1 Tax=Panicum virgatum TaxID=38727 RepID=UPI0019D52D54|nr:structural maintenance of chromosomes protein 6B-like isoform X4 [Panicum virgatum]
MAAGTISRIRLENFMCHSSLHIELGEHVNFITGQNGSGKSAILTALCVAFGCRAKNTQRAASLKDFIKTGCSYASILVDISNHGEDAFKPEVFGNVIILERRITESSSSTVLKDQHGRKVAHRKDDLVEIIEHFNFFFKATLLQQVNDLLGSIRKNLNAADSIVEELERSIMPVLKELDDIQDKIKYMEHIEEIAHEIENLKKKLAWAWVYDVDKKIGEQTEKLEKLRERIPACQERIDRNTAIIEELSKELIVKKENVRSFLEKTQEVRRMKEKMQHDIHEQSTNMSKTIEKKVDCSSSCFFSLAVKLKMDLEKEHARGMQVLNKMNTRVKQLEVQVHEFQLQHMQQTQAEVFQVEDSIRELQQEINSANLSATRLSEEEKKLSEELHDIIKSISDIGKEVDEDGRRINQLKSQIEDLRRRQHDKLTAFGGDRVQNLYRSIERHHSRFKCPPIGPIGYHVQLASDCWSLAVDCALGRLLDAFIVSCHKDSLVLRECAKEVKYHNLQIIIYDFAKPRLDIPNHLLPSTTHLTILSVIHSENPTILNVLVDQGHAERQVLVRDYEVGKSVAFDKRIRNLKEVYTSDGCKMFYRGSVETILPPNRKWRAGRLCTSLGEKIIEIENEAAEIKKINSERLDCKGKLVIDRDNINSKLRSLKRKREDEEQHLERKKVQLDDTKKISIANKHDTAVDTSELEAEMMQVKEDIGNKELVLEKINLKLTDALREENDKRASYKDFIDILCFPVVNSLHILNAKCFTPESAHAEMGSISDAEHELQLVEEKIHDAQQDKAHYEGVMEMKVLAPIQMTESELTDLQKLHQEYFEKASRICAESEVEALGGVGGSTLEQLSDCINKLNQKFQQESRRYTKTIDDLRALHDKKGRKILRKQQMYEGFRGKLNACQKALDLRWRKFQRNTGLLKRQLTWLFNEHLGKKGISGHINVHYKNEVLSVELTMPQDASRDTVRDTRGLSGGERSFSTLCFTLALHGMTEAPFRAMDEFDVFMDAVSRKISLDTLVDFAVAQGSQWIFITPHDISMVKAGDRIKKQQMAAPRG